MWTVEDKRIWQNTRTTWVYHETLYSIWGWALHLILVYHAPLADETGLVPFVIRTGTFSSTAKSLQRWQPTDSSTWIPWVSALVSKRDGRLKESESSLRKKKNISTVADCSFLQNILSEDFLRGVTLLRIAPCPCKRHKRCSSILIGRS